MSVDPRFERFVLAELALRERRARRRDGSPDARVLAQRLHRRDDLLAHLRRVVQAVPNRFRRVAWFHHANESGMTPYALSTIGLTKEERSALELLAAAGCASRAIPLLDRARALSKAPGSAGYLARVVERAAIADRFAGAQPVGETLTALSPARSTAGDVNRCRVIAAARMSVTNGTRPGRRDHAGLAGQGLVTAWARVATIERGPTR